MPTHRAYRTLAEGATDRAGVRRLVEVLGYRGPQVEIPVDMLARFGLEEGDVAGLAVVGRSGPVDALLLEMARGEGAGTAARAARLARQVRRTHPARLQLFVVASAGYEQLVIGTFGLDETFRHLVLHRGDLRTSDVEALEEMAPAEGESGLGLVVRQAAALERTRITRRFFRDFRARRDALAAAWRNVPEDALAERAQLALLFLCRLTFLYFLQRQGALGGRDRYLARLFGEWSAACRDGRAGQDRLFEDGRPSFYRSRLVPLFFESLNRRPEHRTPAARELGPLPYLNGGLFEAHALERRFPEIDLPDGEVRACLDDLLERYRFTTREAPDGAGLGVDPEVLGRVFEGLMAPDRRSGTGTFYTPPKVVDRVVREAVATYVAGACPGIDGAAVARGDSLPAGERDRVRRSLERIRVLDPACGSGAFLLGALHRLGTALAAVDDRGYGPVRRGIVATSLHGVDLLEDAALLCSLRLWLALTGGSGAIRPLPNLDRRIRQGDALIDPLELRRADPAGSWHPLRDGELRAAFRAVEAAGRRYLESGPDERTRCRTELRTAESTLARLWIAGLRRSRTDRLRRLRARAADRDLFGQIPPGARAAAAEAARVEERVRELDRLGAMLEDNGALPFFSFGVHFGGAGRGFDLVLSNPPWVRAHRWAPRVRRLSDRFEVCRNPGWAGARDLTGAPAGAGAQVDLSLLFAERSIRLLAPGGALGVLLPAKFMRALYGGPARRMFLRELEFTLIEDHSLDHRSIFDADAFVAVVVGRRSGAAGEVVAAGEVDEPIDPRGAARSDPASRAAVRVRLFREGVPPLEYTVPQVDLALVPGDPTAPWILAPPDVLGVLRHMQRAGPPLGRHGDLRVRRGVMTGANDVLLLSSVSPGLGGLSRVRAAGYDRARRRGSSAGDAGRFEAVIETDAIRPVVRGAGVDAFRYELGGHVVWDIATPGRAAAAAPRLQAYLDRHRGRLERRSGWRPGLPLGTVFRRSADTVRPKVAWHDLSDTLRATVLPATVRFDGVDRELVPLNTVYFIPVADPNDALLLAGILNSVPIRTLARAVAERAKDARFRFFAWTVASLPLPEDWRHRPGSASIRDAAARAHDAGGLGPAEQEALDGAVARLYGLDPPQLRRLEQFDRWLRGQR